MLFQGEIGERALPGKRVWPTGNQLSASFPARSIVQKKITAPSSPPISSKVALESQR
jgi:hypothetical protein